MEKTAYSLFFVILMQGCTPAARGGGAVRHGGAGVSHMEPFGYTVRVMPRYSEAVRKIVRKREYDTDYKETSIIYLESGLVYRGELVACDEQRIYILLHEQTPDAYVSFKWDEIDDCEIDIPTTAPAGAFLYSSAGGFSAISHGYFMVFTIPMWVIVGIPVTVLSAFQRIDLPVKTLDPCMYARRFARYPQGLPGVVAEKFFRNQAETHKPAADKPVETAPSAVRTGSPEPPGQEWVMPDNPYENNSEE